MMTYSEALYLQTLAVKGFIADCRLAWSQRPELPSASSEEREAWQMQQLEGRIAAKMLWDEGIRFSLTRALTEAEVNA